MGISHLVEQFPLLDRTLPRVRLGRFPTAVEEAPRLAERLGLDSLWVKRDDRSGSLYGGNKVRKLELLYGKALQDHREWVVTTGAWGSHHVLATSIFGRSLGIRVGAVLIPQPRTAHVLETLLCTQGSGTKITPVSSPAAVASALAYLSVRHGAQLILPGGSSALGALAFTAAALELATQIKCGECPEPERIYVALGSSGTHAGLILGAAIAGLRCEVVGVRVTDRYMANELTVSRLASSSARLLRRLAPNAPAVEFRSHHISVVHDQFGKGYGHSTLMGEQAIELSAQHAGLTLDSTYTGKAMAGLIADVHRRPPTGPVLYWNTLSSTDLQPLIERARLTGLPREMRRLYKL